MRYFEINFEDKLKQNHFQIKAHLNYSKEVQGLYLLIAPNTPEPPKWLSVMTGLYLL
jgi:hypothetical protein